MSHSTARLRVTWPRVVYAEWTKLWSLRSTWYVLGGCVLLSAALAALVGMAVRSGGAEKIRADPVALSLSGLSFAQIAVPVLGILLMTSEYSTGMIRATLAAVPARLPVLWSKALVFGAVVLALFGATAFAVFPLAQSFLHGTHLSVSFGDPGVVRGIAGSAAGLVLLGVLGLGLGAVLRSTAAAAGLFVVALTALPQLASVLPYEWVESVARYMPMRASQAMMAARPAEGDASPLAGLAAMWGWAVASMTAASVVLIRRDA